MITCLYNYGLQSDGKIHMEEIEATLQEHSENMYSEGFETVRDLTNNRIIRIGDYGTISFE